MAIKHIVHSLLCSFYVCHFSAEENTAALRQKELLCSATHSLNCCAHLYKWPINISNTVSGPCIRAALPRPLTPHPFSTHLLLLQLAPCSLWRRLNVTAASVTQADSAHTILRLPGSVRYTRHLMLQDDTEYKQPVQTADWFTGHMLRNQAPTPSIIPLLHNYVYLSFFIINGPL